MLGTAAALAVTSPACATSALLGVGQSVTSHVVTVGGDALSYRISERAVSPGSLGVKSCTDSPLFTSDTSILTLSPRMDIGDLIVPIVNFSIRTRLGRRSAP